ncbi:MAG: HAMP domain-containing sensor histidine kinase, partial [Sulfurimonadaceae bacterium]|nr:HAMP domain-containing sensor histidine kinase [Sulfurimonadaceae bacterium]
MEKETTEELKEQILSLSKLTRTGLDKKVERFMKLYDRQKKQHEFILQQSDKQHAQLRKLNQELSALKENLEERVVQESNARIEKEKMLEQQAKMAAMGEMMDAVAHQWKQPLNALMMLSDLLKSDFQDGLVDQAYIDDMTQTTEQQIDHMVNTLNEFRTFFRPDKEPEPFGLKRCIQSVMFLVNDEFMKHSITIDVESEQEIIVNGIENEFKHLILNIINNAKDAFIERERKQRAITIRFCNRDDKIVLEIEDNAGGIPEEVISDIFKPTVTTKAEGKGTGIGLY